MSWQPFNFVTPIAASANIAATAIFTAPVSGYYIICFYAETTTVGTVSTAILTLAFTSGGIARSLSQPSISTTSMASTMSTYQMIYADVGTLVTYALSGMSTGAIKLHIGWKPQGS